MPERAALLNDGRDVEFRVVHLRNLPIEEFSDEVLIVKLEFESELSG